MVTEQLLSTRDLLRKQTRQIHDRIEATPYLAAITGGELMSQKQFLGYLRVQYLIYAVLEHQLTGVLRHSHLNERLCKTEWLTEDFLALGTLPNADDFSDALALAPTYPSVAHAMGGLYVLEGSTMGLRVIAKSFSHLSITRVAGSFLTGYGPKHGAMWKEFVALLDDLKGEERIQALQSAEETFGYVYSIVERYGRRL